MKRSAEGPSIGLRDRVSGAGFGRACSIGAGQGLGELTSNLRRSVLSILSIALGVASVMIMNSLTEGNRIQALKSIGRMGGVSVITVSVKAPRTREEELWFSKSPGLTFEQMEDLRPSAPWMEAVLPEGSHRAKSLIGPRGATRAASLAVVWDYFAHFKINLRSSGNRSVLANRWRQGAPVCLLGGKLAIAMFGSLDSAVGRRIEYDGISLEVAGIVVGENAYDWRDRMCFYPWKIFTASFSGPHAGLDEIKLKVAEGHGLDTAVAAVRLHLRQRHRGIEDFTVRTEEDAIRSAEAANRVIKFVGNAVSSLVLAVGAIGILNLMLASIGSRIQELGVRKALGAGNGAILTQFLTEALTISFTGTCMGLGLGFSMVLLPAGALPVPPTFTPWDCLVAAGCGCGAGLAAGIYPALKAARLSPVEALRNG